MPKITKYNSLMRPMRAYKISSLHWVISGNCDFEQDFELILAYHISCEAQDETKPSDIDT